MRVAWLALLLALPAAAGCLDSDRADAYARDHVDQVIGLEARIGDTIDSLDPATEPGRSLALALASLEAVFHVETVHQRSVGGQGLATSLHDSRWVRLEMAPGTELGLPQADGVDGTAQPEDVYVVWESDELDGNLALDGEKIQAEATTSASVDQIRDLAVEALHTAVKAPGPG